MKFRYLGTAAAEGIPGIFCTCENCRRARQIGGRALRTRSQAVINDELLLDFPADTYDHAIRFGLDLSSIQYCLMTHSHADHMYPAELEMLRPGFAHMQEGYKLDFYGMEPAMNALGEMIRNNGLEKGGYAATHVVSPFTSFRLGQYTITVFPAVHDPRSGPVFYGVSDGKKSLLYANDTDVFREDVFTFLKENRFYYDLISLDCTESCKPIEYVGHMNLERNIKVRDRLLKDGVADEKTVFVCQHFSHNGLHCVYDDFVPYAAKEGFLVAYDGMKLEI